jgi:hypothetical protein
MGAHEKKIIIGQKFNKLTLLSHRIVGKYRMGTFLCDCGKIIESNYSHVKNGFTMSCGCHFKSILILRNTTHGLERHPLIKIYRSIKARCYNKNVKSYKNYGAKGVRMCDEWLRDFKSFYDWCINNGWEPGLQVDKDIKGTGLLYSPDMCCIVTKTVNNRHRSVSLFAEYQGNQKPLMEISELTGVKYGTIKWRLENGWNPEEAICSTRKYKTNKRKTAVKP